MPDTMRPDKTKVVLTIQHTDLALVAHCDIANPLAWRKEPTYSMLKRYATERWGTPAKVLAGAGARRWLITPREDVDLGEVPPGWTYSYVEGADGKIKATLHPPA